MISTHFRIVVAAVLFGACATPYKQQGLGGGYSDARIDGNTFQVSFRGNGYTRRDRVETMLLYRCAELTVEAGFDYFVVVDANAEARQGSYQTPGHYSGSTSVSSFGNTATANTTGTYTPGNTYTWTKHGATALIKTFKGPKPADSPYAYDAREVVQYLGPSVR